MSDKFSQAELAALGNPAAGGASAAPKPASQAAGGAKFRESGGRFFDLQTGAEVDRSKAVGSLIQTHKGTVLLKDPTTSVDPASGMVVSGEGARTEEEIKGAARRRRVASDIREGMKLGQEMIGKGALGRATVLPQTTEELDQIQAETLKTDIRQGRSAEVQDILARRKANLGGLQRQEVQAERARAAQEIGRQTEGQRRALAAIQARTGVRGATAASQQLAALGQGARTRADFERDLFLRNEQIKREALGAYERSVGAAEQAEFGRQVAAADLEKFNIGQRFAAQQINLGQQLQEIQLSRQNQLARQEQERFDLEQAAREKFGQQATALGFAGIASAEVTAEQAAQAQTAAAQASAGCFAPQTLIAMADGSEKRIEDVKMGDQTKYGIVYSLLVTQSPAYDMYEYEGVIVAGSHAVKESGEWVRVREAVHAVPSIYRGLLYNLGVKNHKISANRVMFSDIDELDLVSEIDEMYLDGLNGIA